MRHIWIVHLIRMCALPECAYRTCVCNLLFISRYVRPEGPRQRLAAAHRATAAFLHNHFLAQIGITNHSKASLLLLSWPAQQRKEVR